MALSILFYFLCITDYEKPETHNLNIHWKRYRVISSKLFGWSKSVSGFKILFCGFTGDVLYRLSP